MLAVRLYNKKSPECTPDTTALSISVVYRAKLCDPLLSPAIGASTRSCPGTAIGATVKHTVGVKFIRPFELTPPTQAC